MKPLETYESPERAGGRSLLSSFLFGAAFLSLVCMPSSAGWAQPRDSADLPGASGSPATSPGDLPSDSSVDASVDTVADSPDSFDGSVDDPAANSPGDSSLENEAHLGFKGLYHAARHDETRSNPWNETGYLRLIFRDTLSYDRRYFLHMTGRTSVYRSNYLDDPSFDALWLDRNRFDIWKAESLDLRTDDSFVRSDFQELWAKYEGENWSLKVGRQRINWGEGRLFNPLNVVNDATPMTLEPDELKGTDSIAWSAYFSNDMTLDLVLSFHKSGNHYLSTLERSRVRRSTEVRFSPAGEPVVDFSLYPMALSDPEWQRIANSLPERGEYRERGARSFYQDAALRLKSPLGSRMDLAFVTGYKARRSFAGLDWSASLLDAAFRFGVIRFSSFQHDSDALNRIILNEDLYRYENRPFTQAYAGVDYTFSSRLTAGLQYFYNGGALVDRPITLLGLTREQTDPTNRDTYDFLRAGQVTYRHHFVTLYIFGDLTALIRYDLYLFGETETGSMMLFPQLTYSASESLSLSLGGRLFLVREEPLSDFSGIDSDLYFLASYNIF